MCIIGEPIRKFDCVPPIVAYRIFKKCPKKYRSVYYFFYFVLGKKYVARDMGLRGVPKLMFYTSDGFWSFNTYNEARKYLRSKKNGAYVLAKITIWGRAVEHVHGWRSEFMRIEKIYGEKNHN